MKIVTDPKKIDELLSRGTEDIFVLEHLKEALLTGKQLRVKFGIDPTSPAIHLGRAIPLRKLRDFQNLGHKVVLVIGDFTAKIGDPSDKLEKRPMLTDKDIKQNLKGYLSQIDKIINVSKAEVRYNSEWLAKMDYLETAKLLESFTVQQMTKRRNFKERLDLGQDIFIVEFLYPALQGYDSVKIKADVEIGGFDQLFNIKAGRTVQKKYGQKEQDVMTLSMLSGTDGRKMSSSWGNVISLLDTPNDMFAKMMSVKDELIVDYLTLCTDLPLLEITKMSEEIKSGANPRDIKMKLAREVVRIYHGDELSLKAQDAFINTFQKKEIPDDIEVVSGEGRPMDVLVTAGAADSVSSARRLFDAGAVTDITEDKKLTQTDKFESGHVYKIGKHRFIKIK